MLIVGNKGKGPMVGQIAHMPPTSAGQRPASSHVRSHCQGAERGSSTPAKRTHPRRMTTPKRIWVIPTRPALVMNGIQVGIRADRTFVTASNTPSPPKPKRWLRRRCGERQMRYRSAPTGRKMITAGRCTRAIRAGCRSHPQHHAPARQCRPRQADRRGRERGHAAMHWYRRQPQKQA